jgi:hypothetical protein
MQERESCVEKWTTSNLATNKFLRMLSVKYQTDRKQQGDKTAKR